MFLFCLQYTPEQKEWLVTCSSGEYHEIHRVLTKHPFIAKTRVRYLKLRKNLSYIMNTYFEY